MMLGLIQLLFAVFAIYSVLKFPEGLKLVVPLACLIAMLVVSRVEKGKSEKKTARMSFLHSEIETPVSSRSLLI